MQSQKVNQKKDSMEVFCDKGIVFSICAMIFILPASIAGLDSFAGLAILFYLLKKIRRIVIDWPLKATVLNSFARIYFIFKGFSPPENFLNRPLQLLSLAFFISVVFSQYPWLSLYAYVGKFLKVVFVYICFIEAFRNNKRIWIFLNCFLASVVITISSGLVEHFQGHDFLKGHHSSIGRISSFFDTANAFGAYLLPVIGLSVHFLYTALVRVKNWALGGGMIVLLGFLLACLCWSYSRSAWIGYVVILLIATLLDRRKLLIIGVLFLVFTFIFIPSLNNTRHLRLINDTSGVEVTDKSSFELIKSDLQQGPILCVKSLLSQGGSGRSAFWKKALTIIDSSPIYGTGLNTYTRVIRRNPDQSTWWYAHNCYLQIAAETGFFGLACFLWMIFVLLYNAFSYSKKITDLWTLTILQGALCGLVGFLVQSFFDNTFYSVQLGILMWLIFGLIGALTQLNHAKEVKS